MSFDLQGMRRLVAEHGRVARVVVARSAGSVPREVGAAMVVWPGGQTGTIWGGALEFAATKRACAALETGDRLDKVPLGPGVGQCCGGVVSLVTEIWDQARLTDVVDAVVRPLPGGMRGETGDFGYFSQDERAEGHAQPERPFGVAKRVSEWRNGTRRPRAEVLQGWFLEPVLSPERELWIWGAGHVGRAVVGALAPLPDWRITWVDTGADRFPEEMTEGVVRRVSAAPQTLVPEASIEAAHLILTYSHALDFELCHRLLGQSRGWIGLIGSATKWARFRKRLTALGHVDPHRITCPIGDPTLGKHPQAIALGVAADLLRQGQRGVALSEVQA